MRCKLWSWEGGASSNYCLCFSPSAIGYSLEVSVLASEQLVLCRQLTILHAWVPFSGWTLAATETTSGLQVGSVGVVSNILSAASVRKHDAFLYLVYIIHSSIRIHICIHTSVYDVSFYIHYTLQRRILELFVIAFGKQIFVCSVLFLPPPPPKILGFWS